MLPSQRNLNAVIGRPQDLVGTTANAAKADTDLYSFIFFCDERKFSNLFPNGKRFDN